LERGYRVVGWTFDSMRAQNANFNLRRLGAYVQDFIPNLYGELTDALNAGLPTDRYEVTWDLRDPRVEAAARGEIAAAYTGDPLTLPVLVTCDGDHLATAGELPAGLEAFRLEIPANYGAAMRDRPDLGRAWQTAIRELSQAAFSNGYRAVDVVRDQGRCWYVLTLQPE
jgi:predicted GNAT superfamily acetyltransferase